MPVSRRNFLLASAAPLLAQKSAAPRPNILLILTESLPAFALGCYGNREILTPNLDLLARGGSLFTCHASCAPSPRAGRASLLTGLVPRQHGVEEQPAVVPASFASATMISDVLAGAGYHCGYFGLWGLGDDAKPQHAFQEWNTQAGAPTLRAVRFLELQKPDQPFFLVASYPNPREPYAGLPPAFYEKYAASRFDSLGWLPAARNASSGKEYLSDTVGSLRKCAAAITAFDSEIPALISALDAGRLREQTLVIFTAAAGHLMGRHGLWGSGRASDPVNMYEEAVMTPMLWNWRGKVPVEAVRPEVINGDDLFPSLCEVAGLPAPAKRPLAGSSYVLPATNKPLPKNAPWRNLVFSHSGNTEMVRNARFKVVLRDGGKGPGELYDLRKDPRELSNQYDNAEFLTVRAALTRDLEQWRKQYA
jgi:arylsulfatase A-like enzyme